MVSGDGRIAPTSVTPDVAVARRKQLIYAEDLELV